MKDIKKYIKEHGSTISKVAEQIGITQGSLSLQIDRQTMSVKRAEQIANALGVTLSEMFADDDNINITCPHCGKVIHLNIAEKPE